MHIHMSQSWNNIKYKTDSVGFFNNVILYACSFGYKHSLRNYMGFPLVINDVTLYSFNTIDLNIPV